MLLPDFERVAKREDTLVKEEDLEMADIDEMLTEGPLDLTAEQREKLQSDIEKLQKKS